MDDPGFSLYINISPFPDEQIYLTCTLFLGTHNLEPAQCVLHPLGQPAEQSSHRHRLAHRRRHGRRAPALNFLAGDVVIRRRLPGFLRGVERSVRVCSGGGGGGSRLQAEFDALDAVFAEQLEDTAADVAVLVLGTIKKTTFRIRVVMERLGRGTEHE
jgi:hypothetical protein